MEYNRVDIAPFEPPSSSKDSSSSNGGAAAKKKTRYVGSHADTLFQYEISVGPTQEVFECTPAQVLEVYKALSKDAKIVEQLRFIETNYFRDGLLGYVHYYFKRALGYRWGVYFTKSSFRARIPIYKNTARSSGYTRRQPSSRRR